MPQFAQATAEPNYVHNTTVSFGGVQAKYVKLTILNNWAGSTKQAGLSEVRFFYVPVKAHEPTPASRATGVPIDGTLNWRPGREAARHEVYVGTDRPLWPWHGPGQDRHRAQAVPSATVGLEYGKTYYWKVNEVNDAADPDVLGRRRVELLDAETSAWSMTSRRTTTTATVSS